MCWHSLSLVLSFVLSFVLALTEFFQIISKAACYSSGQATKNDLMTESLDALMHSNEGKLGPLRPHISAVLPEQCLVVNNTLA